MRLAAITVFQDPTQHPRRLQNYLRFRDGILRQDIALLTVEHVVGGKAPRIVPAGETHVCVIGGDTMNQRQRLLNHGIGLLPSSYDAVAWLDADVIMLDPTWRARAELLLQDKWIIQLFHLAITLPKDEYEFCGLGRVEPSYLARSVSRAAYGLAGVAWAARRELLDKLGIYDACVAGGGDEYFVQGVTGKPDRKLHYPTSQAFDSHFYQWTTAFSARVGDGYGFVNSSVLRLWSPMEQPAADPDSVELLRAEHFDPASDIQVGASGAWQWASNKPVLQHGLRESRTRREPEYLLADVPVDPARGMLTCADCGDFAEALRLIAAWRALAPQTPVHLIDLGLNRQQRLTLAELGIPCSHFDCQGLAVRAGLAQQAVRAWVVPLLLASSPFQQTLFIEPGLDLTEDPEVLFNRLGKRPLRTASQWVETAQGNPAHAEIVGLDRQRDAGFLDQWSAWVWEALVYPDRRNTLLWTLLMTDEGQQLVRQRGHVAPTIRCPVGSR